MKKIYKNIVFLSLFLILVLGIMIINIITDPFNIKGNLYTDSILRLIPKRNYAYTCINLTKNKKCDYVFITGSSGEASINNAYFFKKYGSIAVLALVGTSPNEQLALLKYFLKLHPETKNVIVSLEYNIYLKCYNEYTIPRKPTNALTDFMMLNFSVDATKESIQKIIWNIKQKTLEKTNQEEVSSEDKNNNYIVCFVNEKRKYPYEKTCVYDNFEYLIKIHNLIKEKQLNEIYFIPPVNVLYLAHAYSQGIYNDIETYKKMAAQIVPYYDMAYVNKYTTKPLGFYFRDVMHTNQFAFNHKILNTIIDKSNTDKDFATYVTKDNVNQVLQNQRNSLMEYISKNDKKINSYIEEVYDSNFDNKYEYPIYFNDLSDEEKKLVEINSMI